MNKLNSIFAVVILISLGCSLLMCFKYNEAFSVKPTANDVAISLEAFAKEIENGGYKYSPDNLSKRIRRMAEGEQEIHLANENLALSTIYWAIAALAIAVFQALLLRDACNILTRKNHITKCSNKGGAV